jgi:cytosine/adenosine deaminase-related metal-dependent hydrolase
MRKISADYIFPISAEPIKNGVVTIADDGTIIEVSAVSDSKNNQREIEYHKGIICPGFVNTHCHLELSHLRSQISENKGMTGFIKEVISKRSHFSKEQIQQAIEIAEAEMIKNGIVAVGDISNDNSTFRQKGKKNLLYHTFIEIFDFNPDRANEVFENALTLKKQLSIINCPFSIVPHAPYSVSEKLFRLISEEAIKNNSIISIHNQESLGESELFISQSGVMFEAFKQIGINMDLIKKTGVNSLQTTLPKLPQSQKTLLVHNTFTSKEDIQWAEKLMENGKWKMKNGSLSTLNSALSTLYWCTCPNANMYIENKLPNYNYFIEENVHVTIGTDSLASNWSLSVLDELKTITKQYPHIPLQTLLLWSTKNGADFLGFTQLGTIEIGKKPGLNLLSNVNELKISEKTEVKCLIL